MAWWSLFSLLWMCHLINIDRILYLSISYNGDWLHCCGLIDTSILRDCTALVVRIHVSKFTWCCSVKELVEAWGLLTYGVSRMKNEFQQFVVCWEVRGGLSSYNMVSKPHYQLNSLKSFFMVILIFQLSKRRSIFVSWHEEKVRFIPSVWFKWSVGALSSSPLPKRIAGSGGSKCLWYVCEILWGDMLQNYWCRRCRFFYLKWGMDWHEIWGSYGGDWTWLPSRLLLRENTGSKLNWNFGELVRPYAARHCGWDLCGKIVYLVDIT
jgi:hypothetical protein